MKTVEEAPAPKEEAPAQATETVAEAAQSSTDSEPTKAEVIGTPAPESKTADPSAEEDASAEEPAFDEPDFDEAEVEATDPNRNRLQLYTPSSLLNWGQYELKYFQQIYTQTQFYSATGEAMNQGLRSTYYSGIGNVTLGYNNRLNFGFDFWVQAVRLDDEESSPFAILKFQNTNSARVALTTIGPKVKWQPFSRVGGFTIQSSFLIPVARDPEGRMNGRPFLATQNFLWWTQAFYTLNFSDRWQLFAEVDFYWNLDRGFDFSRSGFIAMPASAFLSFFPTNKLTFYVMNQFWPTLGENVVSSWWYQVGLGAKYQLTPGIDLELMHGRFLAGRGAAGPAQTFNLGVRFVKW